ncbi:MAG: MBOAT family O-acyltransferase [Lachnospiraceae bacterium]|nr:MBOAT family O-acyltransferase [Lachnospiraceae bacterium]
MPVMTYNSLFFVTFFTAFLIIYLLMPHPVMRQIVILAGNVFFYKFAGGLNPMMVLIASAFLVYLITLRMDSIYRQFEREAEGLTRKEQIPLLAAYKKRTRIYLTLGVIVLIGVLVYVKVGRYVGLEEVAHLKDLSFAKIIVPLGISYYTFSAVGYMADVYWRKAKAERNLLTLIACMTYFPTIVQGPIGRYDRVMQQFHELPGFRYERVCHGLQRMWWGFFKKAVIADRITPVTSMIFADIFSYAGVEVFLAVIGNVIAIYMDFSGCMDIVIGAAETMGVTLDENFRQPFFSKSAAEFWRRWHITLGAWAKDYVYKPIAMNPRFMKLTGKIRKSFGAKAANVFASAVPLLIVWLLTGLWHGTGKNYIVWGLYWGTVITLSRIFEKELKAIPKKLNMKTESFGYGFFQMLRTCILFAIGRMITACPAGRSVLLVLGQMFSEPRFGKLFDGSLYTYGINEKNMHVVIIGIAIVWFVDILSSKFDVRAKLDEQPLVFRWVLYYLLVMSVIIFGIYGNAYDATAFVYGGF